MVTLVAPHEVEQVWPTVWGKIASAVELESEADVRTALEAGNRILLMAGEGVAVVRGCGDFLEINYVGGSNIQHWKDDLNAAIAEVARGLGLKRIIALGRKGWARIWPEYRNTKKLLFIRDL